MRTYAIRACLIGVFSLAAFGIPVSVSAQAAQAPLAQPPVPAADTRRLTLEEAVRLAVQNNLGLQVQRFNPQLQDLSLALARTAWNPSLTTTFQQNGTNQPSTGFLSGSATSTHQNRFTNNTSVQQILPTGGQYSIGWDTSRTTSNSVLTSFPTNISSNLSLSFSQPLLRGFRVDSTRNQLLITQKNREIADVNLQQQVATTSRSVRNAYWDLAYARAALQVAQQSLDLANQSLRDTQTRVEIGTTPPIDVVEAQSEVASREEAVIVAQSNIETAEDTLRALVYDPQSPDFWTLHIEPTELPTFAVAMVDVDGAVQTALNQRLDLQASKKSLEANDINIRYLRNQALPDVTASLDYGLVGVGGLQVTRTSPFGGDVISSTSRSYGSTLADLFGQDFPSWTAGVSISYPIGHTQQEASLAQARLQYNQTVTQLKNQQLQVATQVRQAARAVVTNQKRVDSNRAARELAEQRLTAEQRKFAAGTSTNFQVFQAQRDLAQARSNELQAILDYQRSVVDLDTVQQVPLTGGGATTVAPASSTGTAATGTAAR
ncbi:MAG TPA: TolC family protein [Vicinamibacterales bacterium]|jgi:outer membrane protein TolC|nr:TolC family protein [Vicinamibacterales bacterium]